MALVDELLTWDTCIDHALGEARRVLDHVTAGIMQTPLLTIDNMQVGINIAEEWRMLAGAWGERQSRQSELNAAVSALEEEEDEYPVE